MIMHKISQLFFVAMTLLGLAISSNLQASHNGGMVVDFASFTKMKEIKVPVELGSIEPGLNLKGICSNQDCKYFKKEMWIPRGLKSEHKDGVFRIGHEQDEVHCIHCTTTLAEVYGCGFYQALFYIKGRLQDTRNVMKKGKSNQKESCLTFDDGKNLYATWRFLKIKVVATYAGFTLLFPDLRNSKEHDIDIKQKQWQNIRPGVNIEIFCQNTYCRLYKKKIWQNSGFDKTIKCFWCNTCDVIPVRCLLYQCGGSISGKDQQGVFQQNFKITNPNKMLMYQSVNSPLFWSDLNVDIKTVTKASYLALMETISNILLFKKFPPDLALLIDNYIQSKRSIIAKKPLHKSEDFASDQTLLELIVMAKKYKIILSTYKPRHVYENEEEEEVMRDEPDPDSTYYKQEWDDALLRKIREFLPKVSPSPSNNSSKQ